MVLITGRQLEHWHTGSMTRRATVLDAIEPDPVALVHPLDLEAMGGRRATSSRSPRAAASVAVCARRRQLAARRDLRARSATTRRRSTA
jgi:formate dehydrogenase major subunit